MGRLIDESAIIVFMDCMTLNMNDLTTNPETPKRWVVSALASPKQPMTISCDGRPLQQTTTGSLDGVSPVEFLLISIAGCFALSCCGALKARGFPPTTVEVTVTGEKARDPPSRLGKITMATAFARDISAQDAAAIAQDAKHLCTVTNTILEMPELELTARSTYY